MHIRNILDLHFTYRFYQWFVGANRYTRLFADRFIRYAEGERVLDIGCGPATIIKYLPAEVDYTGIDSNQGYIRYAENRYGKLKFICSDTDDLSASGFSDAFDKVFCIGVLHHLTDEQVKKMLQFACSILRKGGMFLALEPVYSGRQGLIEKWFMKNDRGRFIRTPEEYLSLAGTAFGRCKHEVLKGTMNIPFTIIIFKAVNKA